MKRLTISLKHGNVRVNMQNIFCTEGPWEERTKFNKPRKRCE